MTQRRPQKDHLPIINQQLSTVRGFNEISSEESPICMSSGEYNSRAYVANYTEYNSRDYCHLDAMKSDASCASKEIDPTNRAN